MHIQRIKPCLYPHYQPKHHKELIYTSSINSCDSLYNRKFSPPDGLPLDHSYRDVDSQISVFGEQLRSAGVESQAVRLRYCLSDAFVNTARRCFPTQTATMRR